MLGVGEWKVNEMGSTYRCRKVAISLIEVFGATGGFPQSSAR
jgi:hypothetical protein